MSTNWISDPKHALALVLGEIIAPGTRIFETLERGFKRVEPNHQKLLLRAQDCRREIAKREDRRLGIEFNQARRQGGK
mgnify:CR=1 FL=1